MITNSDSPTKLCHFTWDPLWNMSSSELLRCLVTQMRVELSSFHAFISTHRNTMLHSLGLENRLCKVVTPPRGTFCRRGKLVWSPPSKTCYHEHFWRHGWKESCWTVSLLDINKIMAKKFKTSGIYVSSWKKKGQNMSPIKKTPAVCQLENLQT